MMCLSNDNWPLNHLFFNIQSMVETFKVCFSNNSQGDSSDRFIKWNNNNFSSVILNVDGSCLGSPVRAGYSGVLHNDICFFLLGLFGYIHCTSNILHAELYAIYQTFCLPKTWILLTLFVTLILCIASISIKVPPQSFMSM